jgi:hypothetical protein
LLSDLSFRSEHFIGAGGARGLRDPTMREFDRDPIVLCIDRTALRGGNKLVLAPVVDSIIFPPLFVTCNHDPIVFPRDPSDAALIVSCCSRTTKPLVPSTRRHVPGAGNCGWSLA